MGIEAVGCAHRLLCRQELPVVSQRGSGRGDSDRIVYLSCVEGRMI